MKRWLFTPLFLLPVLSLSFMGNAQAKKPVLIQCKTYQDGSFNIGLKVSSPDIKIIILKAILPQDVGIIDAHPAPKAVGPGGAKWLLDVKGRQYIDINGRLNKFIPESKITLEAMFKIPGNKRMMKVLHREKRR